jgi:sugar-specific transcriptional regulator TrmB
MGLGLTFLQAKTYFALVKAGSASVEVVSRGSGVALEDAGRVLVELQELGLVEAGSSEGVYVAVPLRKGLMGLLQQKADENAVLQVKTHKLIEDFDAALGDAEFGDVEFREVESQFEVISDREVLFRKADESTDAAQRSQDAVLDVAGFQVMVSYGKKAIKRALDRGVRVRVITAKPENPEEARDPFGFKHPLLTVKYVPPPVPISLLLFDDKELHLRITKNNIPSFWTNNPHIINLSRTYFDEIWNKL